MSERACGQTRVWAYWEGAGVPPLVQKCLDSWYRHLPKDEYSVYFLTPESEELAALSFPATFDKIQPAQRADLIRLRLLEKYGGIWMDASVYLTEPLDWLQKEGVFFFRQPGRKYPENWFIYSAEPEPIMGTLARVMEDAFADSEHPSRGAAETGDDAYFVMYDCWVYLCQTDWMFQDYTADWVIRDYREWFYNPLIPLESHDRLVKFTKKGRSLHDRFAFPVPYVVIASTVLLIVAIVFMCRKKS